MKMIVEVYYKTPIKERPYRRMHQVNNFIGYAFNMVDLGNHHLFTRTITRYGDVETLSYIAIWWAVGLSSQGRHEEGLLLCKIGKTWRNACFSPSASNLWCCYQFRPISSLFAPQLNLKKTKKNLIITSWQMFFFYWILVTVIIICCVGLHLHSANKSVH